MSLSARDQEALDGIADELAGPDSNLAAMLDTFTRLTAGEQMPRGEEIGQSPRVIKRRPRKRPGLAGATRSLAWLPAAVILAVTAIIAITVVLSGGGKPGACASVRGLTCAGQVHAYPPASRSTG